MATRRWLVDTLLALILLAAFATLGWLVADPVLTSFASSVPDGKLIATSPADLVVYRLKLAIAWGSIPLAAWCIALIHRVRQRAVPGLGVFWLYLAVPSVAAVVGMAARVFWLRAWMQVLVREVPSTGIEPMVTVGGLSTAGWTAMFGWVAAAVLAALLVVRKK